MVMSYVYDLLKRKIYITFRSTPSGSIRTIGIDLQRDFLKNITSVPSDSDGNLVPSEAPDTLLQGDDGH